MVKCWLNSNETDVGNVKKLLKEWIPGVRGVYKTIEPGCFRVQMRKGADPIRLSLSEIRVEGKYYPQDPPDIQVVRIYEYR
jgi:hypothetical protein